MARKFHDMSEQERAQRLAWANSHDWGAGPARYTENLETGKICMYVECAAKVKDGDWFVESYLADGPVDLKAWAGY